MTDTFGFLSAILRYTAPVAPLILADAWLHHFDPFLIEFPASWPLDGIRWYGLAYLAGFLLGWALLRRLAVTQRISLTARQVGDLVVYVIVGVLVGGRLGYVLFYDQSLVFDFGGAFPFWGVLAINRGGMASHGGMIGVIIACLIFTHQRGISKLHLLDVAPLAATPGLFFGRLANFVNGELLGRAVDDQTSPPWWSVKFPQELREARFWPTEKLASLTDIVKQFGIDSQAWLDALVVSSERTQAGLDARRFIGSVFTRIEQAVQNDNQAVIRQLEPLLTARYPSQLFQALTDGIVLAAVLVIVWLVPRKPGVVGAWFLITYGVLRILTELYRLPDEGVAKLPTPLVDLSRGQVLSVLMVLAGIVSLVIVSRRDVAKTGGLIRRAE